jgi:hypothetical protein
MDLSLWSRVLLPPGISSLGRDRSNDMVLPVEAAPAHVGKIDWSGGDSAILRLEPGIPAVVDGQKVSEVAVSKPVIVTVGQMKLRVAIRGAELRVSVQDANARMRRDAKPPVWFPIDLRYRITADWVAFPEAKMVRIPDNDGGSREWKSPTIHLEDPSLPGSIMPDNTNFPGLKLDGYTTTPAIVTPPSHRSEGVIIEWTDTNISNSTFEGTAREVLRLQLNTYSHPLGEFTFNPAARPGDPDWRVMYVGCGDSRTGEEHDPILRLGPQRLDLLVGKIWRIIPDPNEHKDSSTLSENGRYRIPMTIHSSRWKARGKRSGPTVCATRTA